MATLDHIVVFNLVHDLAALATFVTGRNVVVVLFARFKSNSCNLMILSSAFVV